MGVLIMLVLVSAVSLTVILSQQQQTIKQRASESDSCTQTFNDCSASCNTYPDAELASECMNSCGQQLSACSSSTTDVADSQTSNPQSQDSTSSTLISEVIPTSAPTPTPTPASSPVSIPASAPQNYNSCLNSCLDNYCAGSRENNPDCDNQYYETCTDQCKTSNPPPQTPCAVAGNTCTDATGTFTSQCASNSTFSSYTCFNNLCSKGTVICSPGNVCANSSTGPTCQPQAVAEAKCTSDADCGTSQAYCNNDGKSLNRYVCNVASGKCEYKNIACDQGLSCYMNDLLPTCALVTPTPTITPTPTASPSPTPSGSPTPTPTPSCALHDKGDANCDGKIDSTDYGIWQNEMMRQSLGTLTQRTADFSGNDDVGIEDFHIWNKTRLNL